MNTTGERRKEEGGRRQEEKLLALYGSLDAERRKTLLQFAEFLAWRAGADRKSDLNERLPIERPEEETVVMAVRRLTRTYPMLDKRKLLAETSRFIAEHALEGRAAHEVIDELELVFERHYERQKGVTRDE